MWSWETGNDERHAGALMQGSLQGRRFQRRHVTAKSALKRLPPDGCLKATFAADVRPPARGRLPGIDVRVVHLIEHQPPERLSASLRSITQARSVPGFHCIESPVGSCIPN